jgi:putative acyl-CoA dehydrogenase
MLPAPMTYLHSQAEAGTGCPLTMTFAACRPCACSRIWPALAAENPRPEYDPRNVGDRHKAGVTIGMAMTEKQGGTDVRANTTRPIRSVPRPGPGL